MLQVRSKQKKPARPMDCLDRRGFSKHHHRRGSPPELEFRIVGEARVSEKDSVLLRVPEYRAAVEWGQQDMIAVRELYLASYRMNDRTTAVPDGNPWGEPVD